MESLTQLRGHLFLATRPQLLDIIGVNKLKSPPESEELEEIVKMVDSWLLSEIGTENEESAIDSIRKVLFSNSKSVSEPKNETLTVKDSNRDITDKSESISADFDKHSNNYSPFRREFKINGIIDQKSGISFTNLVRQIDLGKKKNYHDIEIIDGVIRAIPTNKGLRNYLEGLPDVSLPTLRGILRAHYKEQTATELYNELGGIVQGIKEEPQEFLLRAMDLRNKINFCSQEKDELRYEPGLVNQLFIRAVETGLLDQSIRQEFRPFICDKEVCDEVLIQKLSEIVTRDTERKNKVKKKKTEIGTAELKVEMAETRKKQDMVTENKLLVSELKTLKEEFAEVKELLKQRNQPVYQNQSTYRPIRNQPPVYHQPVSNSPARGPPRSCYNCYRDGHQNTCRHCWRCGLSGHLRFECRANLARQGNEQGSQPRDRE